MASNNPTSNARREDRFPAAGKMILLMPWGRRTGEEQRRVRLLDCSAHGMGIEDSAAMEPGDEFVVYLKLTEVAMVLYKVRHCRRQESGTYKIGATLAGFIGAGQNADRVLTSLIEERLV